MNQYQPDPLGAVIGNPQHSLQLAIETTSRTGSVALFSKEHLLRSVSLDPNRRTAAALAPVIDEMLRNLRRDTDDVDARPDFISVADGPGSFTGLRIGVTTAKTLCFAWSIPLVAVDSLAAIAATGFDANADVNQIMVAINAYRGQVFCGNFDRKALLPTISSSSVAESLGGFDSHPDCVRVQSVSSFQSELADLPPSISLAGDPKMLGERANQHIGQTCDAIGVGLLAWRAALQGDFTDPMTLVPRYLKESAAEEKSARKK